MVRRIHTVAAMIVGSFLVYCGQSAMPSLGVDGASDAEDAFVPDAHAEEACGCSTGPTFTKLAEGTLSTASPTSAPIPVGAYREIIVYATTGTPAGCVYYDFIERFRPDAATPFGHTGFYGRGGRFRVDGADLQLGFQTASSTSYCQSMGYIVAGVR